MINWEEFSFKNGSPNPRADDGPGSSTVGYPHHPMSPESSKRFIVEPQVLNAALELDVRTSPVSLSPRTAIDPSSGGLPPPPRPHSHKGRPQRSVPSSPVAGGGEPSTSAPNSPLSSPFPNSPETPNPSDNGVKPSPRLSNIFRGEAILFSSIHRQSVANQDEDLCGAKNPPPSATNVPPWFPSDHGDLGSPQGSSSPSSPEMAAVSVDGSRPGRPNRYLNGLQKITKLGRSIGSISGDSALRTGRRMSEVELNPRRLTKKGSEDMSSRYRRILDKSVKTVGEVMLIKSSTSVPVSPVSTVKNNVVVGDGARREGRSGSVSGYREGGGRGRFNSGFSTSTGGGSSPSATTASAGAATATARASPVATPPRVWVSHGRRPSDLSSSSSPPSASETSHEPPSSFSSGPRISISSTIYPTSSNNHSLDLDLRAPAPAPDTPMPTISPDRDSFIDLASPSLSPRTPEFATIPVSAQRPHPYSSQSLHSSESTHGNRSPSPPPSASSIVKPPVPRLAGAEKPPVPTAPKPDFSHRSRTKTGSPAVQAKKPGHVTDATGADLDLRLPPSITHSAHSSLTPRERAERIRTTRKLAQVFGQPPGVPSLAAIHDHDGDLANGCMPIPSPLQLNLSAKRRLHRPAASMSDDVANSSPVYDAAGGMVWPPPEGTRYVTLAARRYSAPLSPEEYSFVSAKSFESDALTAMDLLDSDASSVIHIGSAENASPLASDAGSILSSPRSRATAKGPGSPRSFMDLSDEEATVETPRVSRGRSHPFSPSTASLADSVSSEQLAEDERRRKREKLAKLHRFLGSRVPPHLVLGPLDEGTPLPPPATTPIDALHEEDGDVRKSKMRRRRSSSAAEFSRKWSDEIDRLKDELNEREKAINVRRAVKMEKMFGVAPPQTLYHTRAPVGSTPSIVAIKPRQASPAPKSPSSPAFRFTPSSKMKSKKRPSTADSAQPLIDNEAILDIGQSSVYMHYRHSLNSLNDIIDRDDRESLAELHDYLTGAVDHIASGEQYDYQFTATTTTAGAGAAAPTSPFPDDTVAVFSPKSERRRSLPSRISVTSLVSEVSAAIAASPTAPETSFQQRRRRAAKLTHFFGVDYRDLMSEVLESIEQSLEEERGKGTLKPDEVKELQQKLFNLKTKRNSLTR